MVGNIRAVRAPLWNWKSRGSRVQTGPTKESDQRRRPNSGSSGVVISGQVLLPDPTGIKEARTRQNQAPKIFETKPKTARLAREHPIRLTHTFETAIPTFRVQTVTMAAERTNVSNDLIWQITRMYLRNFCPLRFAADLV